MITKNVRKSLRSKENHQVHDVKKLERQKEYNKANHVKRLQKNIDN